MLDTIELRLDNAAGALLHVAVNVMETGCDNLEAIFQDKTLGKLHPSRTIVKTLFRKFMALKEFRHYHYEILQEYMEELDFASVSNEKQRKYIQLFGQHMGVFLNNSQLNNSKMENEVTKTSNDDSEAPKNANEHPASQVTNFSRLKPMPFLVEIATADTIKNDDIKIHRYSILACPIGYELVRRNLIDFDPPKMIILFMMRNMVVLKLKMIHSSSR